MADEKVSKETTPSGPTEIVVRNSDGETFSTRLKDEKGRFVKKEKTMPSSRELTRRGRNLLFKKTKDPETGEVRTQFDAMTQYMISIATGQAEGDPKALAAAVQAYEKVLKRLIGKEPLSDEDREAQKDSNTIRFVLIPPLENSAKIKEALPQPLRPAFIEAEVVRDKK